MVVGAKRKGPSDEQRRAMELYMQVAENVVNDDIHHHLTVIQHTKQVDQRDKRAAEFNKLQKQRSEAARVYARRQLESMRCGWGETGGGLHAARPGSRAASSSSACPPAV